MPYSLQLFPFGKQPLSISLSEKDSRGSCAESIIHNSASGIIVYSDLTYEFELSAPENDKIDSVDVYINDVYEASSFSEGRIRFLGHGNAAKRVFLDCYGLVEISLLVKLQDSSQMQLQSDYIPVLVRRGELNDAIKAMVNYVYQKQSSLLLNGDPQPKDIASMREDGTKSLLAQILLAEEIATTYEKNYGYFKANSRFHMQRTATVDRVERMQYISPETMQYIASHPNNLQRVTSTTGIRIRNQVYQPQRVLFFQNTRTFDIEENIVIVGFLKKMVSEIDGLLTDCKNLLMRIPSTEDYNQDYVFSSFLMFSETRKTLIDGEQRLDALFDQFSMLLSAYKDALGIDPPTLINEPSPSAIFLSVPEYNQMYLQIHQWFTYGIYSFAHEKYILSFIRISDLYENYLLIKLNECVLKHGFSVVSRKKTIYPTKKGWKYANTRCLNTFVYVKDYVELTIYYQPMLLDSDTKNQTGIGLYRNNSIPVVATETDELQTGGRYYVPDYLVKVTQNGISHYSIADAKFSDYSTVRRYQVRDLAFKYLFSLSPVSDTEFIDGLAIIYGKGASTDLPVSAYDKQMQPNSISPFMELIPAMEKMNGDNGDRHIDTFISKCLSGPFSSFTLYQHQI